MRVHGPYQAFIGPPGSQKISPGPFAYLLAKDLVLRDPFSRDGPI